MKWQSNLLRGFYLALGFFSELNQAYNDTECNVIASETLYRSFRGTSETRFRLVQYNVEWLFLNTYNGCPGSSCTWKTQADAQTHMEYVQKVAYDMQPTLMNLCEVEGCYELKQLYSGDSGYIPYLIFGKDTSTGQNVGIISKISPLIPLARSEEHIEYPIPQSTCGYTGSSGTQGVSKHYYTRIMLPNGMYALLIGVHFLAYPTDKTRCVEREAQAQVIQNILVSMLMKYPKDEIIIMGDMNDFDKDVLDANGNTPISSVLCILKGKCGKYSGYYTLRNVAEKAATSDRYTDWWDSNNNCISSMNEFSMIDHILVSPNLFDKIENVRFYHEYDEYCGKYNSDHYPIIVDFFA
jgi:exonuclease III